MTVDVFDWDATVMDQVYIDGVYQIQLGPSANEDVDRATFVYRMAGSKDSVEIRTNMPLDQLVMALDNGGAFPNPADKTVIQNDRFKVELKQEAGSVYFVFTALKDYDPAATDNPSILTVTGGRIVFTISITQEDWCPGDWDDGGNIPKNLESLL